MAVVTEHDSQEIRMCALVLSVVAFFLFIAAEIVHEEQYASRGVMLLVAMGALGFAWIGPLTLLAGTLRSKKFQWWQPFQGGAEFVWMQAFGWCLHTFVLTGSVVVLANSQLPKWFEGQYLLLGVAGFVAQILLNLSIGCFREVDTEQPAFQFLLNTKTVVSLLVSASGALLFVFYDLFPHLGQSPVVIAVGCLEFIVSALVIHVFYGCAEIPGYRIWQPFEGERTFLLLQYLGWQLFAFTVGGAMNVFFTAGDLSGYGSSKGTTTAIGAMGMMSQILLLISLQYFDRSSSQKNSDDDTGDDPIQQANVSPLTHEAKKEKRPAEIYVATLLCIGALAIGSLSYASRAKIGLLPDRFEHFFLVHEKVGWVISLCSLAIAAPISNMGGVRSQPFYYWWQPFQGGTKFIFLQTLGWLWYGIYMALSIVLCMNSAKFGDIVACFALLVGSGSAGAIALSLSYFEGRKLHSTNAREADQSLYWCDATKGEVAMVILLSFSSMLFHLLVDFFQERMLPSIKAFCLVLAMALFVLASTISHFSGRKLHPRFRVWQPFEGGSRYVIRQAVGWSLFAVQILFDSLLLSLASQNVPKGVSSLLGLFGLMPQVLILVSIPHFQPTVPTQTDMQQTKQSPQAAHSRDNALIWSKAMRNSSLRWHVGTNVFVAIASICLFVSTEVLRTKGLFHRAEEVLYIFGCLLSVYGIVSAHCVLGPNLHPAYRVFQPFRGGIKFVTFQGAAWTIVSVAWAVSITVLYWSSAFFKLRGIHVLTGFLFFVSQLLLLYSLPLFQATEKQVWSLSRGQLKVQSELKRKAEDLVNQYFVGRLLGFCACSVFVLVDFMVLHLGPSIPMFPATICAVLALFSSIPMAYKFATSSYGPKARRISGSIVFVVLGCALWSFTLLLGALFSYHLWSTQDINVSVSNDQAPTQFMGTFTGSIGFTAQFLFFQASETSLLRKEPGMKLSLEKKLFDLVSKLKDHLTFASIWAYSAIPLASGLLYAHTKSVLPKHLASSQILGLVLCSVVVIWSTWCIQQQIVSSGCMSQHGKRFTETAGLVSETLTSNIPMIDLGLDCYMQIVAFLTISELLVFSSTCKTANRLHSDGFWREVFVRRYYPSGSTHALTSSLVLSGDAVQANLITIRTKPFAATTLNRVESAALNLICRSKLSPSHPAPKSATMNLSSRWKAFCVGHERRYYFDQCKMCNQVEAFSRVSKLWETRENCMRRAPSTWVTLCQCINPVTLRREKAHRVCLERTLNEHRELETEGLRTGDAFCSVCEIGVTETGRFPKTVRELLRVTWDDFRRSGEDFGGGFFIFVPCSASLFILALKSVGWGSCAIYSWVTMVVALCFVINSSRFDRCLATIGGEDSPSFQAYQQAYYVLALSSITHLAWCCPTISQSDAVRNPSLAQMLILLGFRVNFCLFLLVSLAGFFAFWRTQYRVATVTGVDDDDEASQSESSDLSDTSHGGSEEETARLMDAQEDSSCVLCLLKLCSENRE